MPKEFSLPQDGALPVHEQVAPLWGRSAAYVATIGAVITAAGVLVARLQHGEPWPVVIFGGVMFVPTIVIGLAIVALGAFWHATRSTWHLSADAVEIAPTYRTARGRIFKRKSLPVGQLRTVRWIEGDADVAAGLSLEPARGKSLFVPAESFDCLALARFIASAYPQAQLPAQVDGKTVGPPFATAPR